MTRNHLFSFLTASLFFLTARSFCYANDKYPKKMVHIVRFKELRRLLDDTVPDVKKIPETKTDSSSNGTAIKEVPKSKKQIAPVAVPVTVNVKPIKIIKPKIIKPVIKIN